MAGPLLYKPQPRWQVWAALGAAVGIHAMAVGIAALNPEPPEMDLTDIPEAFVELSVETEPAPPEPTPPPEEEPEPLEAPPEPVEPPEFQEEKPTPPPKPRTDRKPVAPIARPRAVGAPTGPAPSGRAAMIFKPNIQYPYEAKRARITGSGVIVVSVTPSGSVSSASMGKSTGSSILDNAATSAFRSARFKPGTVPTVKIPITFTLTGAQF
jgi:periplasmic protein TonB